LTLLKDLNHHQKPARRQAGLRSIASSHRRTQIC